ncbi:MAG: outer membrane protein transport protein [Verrucomicrobiales bacterium]|nr:outer membrane protein transport protein [Verrucomicrobiales bacterium]
MRRIILIIFLTAAPLFGFSAEGLRTLPDTAEAIALAGGRLLLLDDASVVRTNPATLTDFEDTTLTVTYQGWHGKIDYAGPGGRSDSMIDPMKHLGSMYIAHPISDTLSAGLGFSAPYGLEINWPAEGAFKYSGASSVNLKTYAINPALGLKLNDKVSLGVGLDIFKSSLRIQQKFPWALVAGAPVPDGNMEFDGDGWGVGGYAAINFDLNDRHHFALTGRLPVSVDYEGDFSITNIPAPGVGLPGTPFDSEIEYPGSIGAGYAFDVSEKLSVGIDFEWTNNSSHDDLPLNIGANQALLGGNDAVIFDWEDSITFGIGAEYEWTESLTLRGGYQYADSPMSSTTWNPSIPADDRHILSVGAGYEWGLHSIDLAYSKILMGTTSVSGNLKPAFNGNYTSDWDIITLSYTRRF